MKQSVTPAGQGAEPVTVVLAAGAGHLAIAGFPAAAVEPDAPLDAVISADEPHVTTNPRVDSYDLAAGWNSRTACCENLRDRQLADAEKFPADPADDVPHRALPETARIGQCAEWHLLSRTLVAVRSHHEGLVAAPALLTALSLLIPFAGAVWARVVSTRAPRPPTRERESRG